MTQIVIAAKGDNETNKRNVIIAFGVLYLIFSVIQYIFHVIRHDENIQSNSNNERHKFGAMCFLNFLLLLASILCFSGDNMHIFGEQNKKVRIASVCLLFIGLVGFRLIPVLKDEISNYFEKNEADRPNHDSNGRPNHDSNSRPNHDSNSRPNHDSNSRPNHDSNSRPNHDSNSRPNHDSNSRPNHDSNSRPNHDSNNRPNHDSNSRPNDNNDKWKLLNKTVDILQLAPEIDGWFTHFAALVFFEQNSSCSAIWAISIFIIILAACPIFFPALRFYNLSANARDFAEKFQLALYICMWFIVAFLLIGDNNQPLDCTISLTSNSYITGNIIRAIFSAFTFIISATLLIIAVWHGKNNRVGSE